MTTVGVVSDTHFPRFGPSLPEALVTGLKAAAVARLLHCGDHTTARVVELLEAIAPVDAVAGNNDPDEIVRRFGRERIVTIESVRIGLVHGDLGRGSTTPEKARRTFPPGTVDVVCFGHSHQPYAQVHDGVLVLNPGSPTDKRREAQCSYALLTLGDGPPRAKIVRFDRASPVAYR